MPARSSSPIHCRIGVLSKQNCVTTSTRVAVRRPQSRHRLQHFQRVRQFEERMAFGMTGHADGRDPMRLDQSAGADIACRFERAPGGRDIARDQDNARHVGLAPRPRQEIVERLPRGHFARRDVRHRIVAGPAQRRGGLDIVAIIVAGQERDGDISAGSEMVSAVPRSDARARRFRLMPTTAARLVWGMTDRRRSQAPPKVRPARGGARSHRFRR